MKDFILIIHGAIAGCAFYFGFFLLLFMTEKVMSADEWLERNRESLVARAIFHMPVFLVAIGMMLAVILIMSLIFFLSFLPAMLAIAFGPAFFFDLPAMYRCDGSLLVSRTGVTELTGCLRKAAWFGVISGFLTCYYFHFSKPATNDSEKE